MNNINWDVILLTDVKWFMFTWLFYVCQGVLNEDDKNRISIPLASYYNPS